jgi:hypothetical protein
LTKHRFIAIFLLLFVFNFIAGEEIAFIGNTISSVIKEKNKKQAPLEDDVLGSMEDTDEEGKKEENKKEKEQDDKEETDEFLLHYGLSLPIAILADNALHVQVKHCLTGIISEIVPPPPKA